MAQLIGAFCLFVLGVESVGRYWTCEGIGWCDSWWLYAPVYYCVGNRLALRAIGCKSSGCGWNIGELCFGLLMLVGPIGWSMEYMSSS